MKNVKVFSPLSLNITCLMLFIFIFQLLPFGGTEVGCQNIAINTTGAPANATAILDISSTNLGLLIPRMTTIERDLIGSPANSLFIFNTTINCYEGYDAATSSWKPIYCFVVPVVCQSSYTASSIPFDPIAGSGTSVSLADDQTSGAFPIDFTFCFYGNNYTQFVISSNGFISFDLAAPNACCNGVVTPSAGLPDNFVALSWSDWNPSVGGTIDYFTTGIAPNRRLVVRFNSVPEYSCGGNLTGQIILYETTNVIEVHTTSLTILCHTMTTGVENSTGTLGTGAPGRNTVTNPTYSSEAWRFQ